MYCEKRIMCEGSCQEKHFKCHLRDILGDFYCIEITPHGSNGKILRRHIPDNIPHGSNGEFSCEKFSRVILYETLVCSNGA